MEAEKALLRDVDCAALMDIGRATWWNWNSQGLVPAPVRVGGSVRWRSEEIQAWVKAGCPARSEWTRIREGC